MINTGPPSNPIIIPSSNFPWREGKWNHTLICYTTDEGNPKATADWNSTFGTLDPLNDRILLMTFISYEHDEAEVSCKLTNRHTSKDGNTVTSNTVKLAINCEYTILPTYLYLYCSITHKKTVCKCSVTLGYILFRHLNVNIMF